MNQSSVTHHNDSSCLQDMEKLRLLFRSVFGPSGTSVISQNDIGGEPIISRDASSLLRNYEAVHPKAKLVLAAVTQHDARHPDGCSFLGLVLTSVIKKCLSSGHHPRLCCHVLSWCLSETTQFLPSIQINFTTSATSLVQQSRHALAGKLKWYLNEQELESLAVTLAEVFIKSGGQCSSPAVTFHHSRNIRFRCDLYEGVLLDSHHSAAMLPAADYSAVLIQCSLSGDTEELESLTYCGPEPLKISQVLLDKLSRLTEQLIDAGVSLILCQKVIHPNIKEKLHDHSVQYQERLGSTLMTKLKAYTGTAALTSVTESDPDITPFRVSCRHVTIGNDRWIQLRTQDSLPQYSCSLVLGHWSEQIGHVIERSCRQALDVLCECVSDGRLLAGGGRWQRQLADALERQASSVCAAEARKLGASPSAFRETVGYLVTTLRSLSPELNDVIADGVHDSYPSHYAALSTALAVANAVLMIGTTIESR